MKRLGLLRRDRRGYGSGSGLFALSAVLLLTAVDLVEPPPDAGPSPGEVERALEMARREVREVIDWSWAQAHREEDPRVRALQAAQFLQARLAHQGPGSYHDIGVHVLDVVVRVEDPPDVPLSEFAVGLVATLEARGPGGWSKQTGFAQSTPDPTHPQTWASSATVLNPFQGEGSTPVAREFERALAWEFSNADGTEATNPQTAVQRALWAAALSAEWHLSGGRPADAASFTVAPPDSDGTDVAAAADNLSNATILQFLQASCKALLLPSALCALASAGALVERIAAMFRLAARGQWHAVGLFELPWPQAAGAREFIGFLRAAVDLFARGLQTSLQGAREAVQPFTAGATSPSGGWVSYRASNVTLAFTAVREPLFVASLMQRPFEVDAVARFDVDASISLPIESGQILRKEARSAAAVSFSFPAARAPTGLVAVPVAPMAALAGALDQVPAIRELQRLIEQFSYDVAGRWERLRDAVWGKILNSSASVFSRLVFRVVNAIEDGNDSAAATAVFELLERFLADDLRDAMTVNFTWRGIPFSLIPDPVRMQVSLQATRGPDTAGVRLRRVFDHGNPLDAKWKNLFSLALEVYWIHKVPSREWTVVVDPFMRTNEGFLRFSLRSTEGEGLHLELRAPVPVARERTYEISLAGFLPGGIPVLPSPLGGYFAVDVGARARVLEVTKSTFRRAVLRAAERAWLDVVEGLSVKEVHDQRGSAELAVALLRRFIVRTADEFSHEALRWLAEVDLFVRISSVEAAGAAAQSMEVGIAVQEPFVVLREAALFAGFLASAAFFHAARREGISPPAIAWMPQELHMRVGLLLRLSMSAGPPGQGAGLSKWVGFSPSYVAVRLFLSAGMVASIAGQQGIRWVVEAALEWDGLVRRARTRNPLRLDRDDSIDMIRVRAQPLVGARLLISEVLPAPRGRDSDLEFVEIYNPGLAPVSLDGWSLRDSTAHGFPIPPGTRIAPGAVAVIARSSVHFFDVFQRAPDVGTLRLTLNDEGDSVTLLNDEGVMSDRVAWGSSTVVGPPALVGLSLARPPAAGPPVALPLSALAFTGSAADFVAQTPSPGVAPA